MLSGSLSRRLTKLPRVLAGPLLRKVTPQTVTVWLALRVGAAVTLVVLDERDKEIMRGSRRTVAIGENLHIVAVTAQKLPSDPDLTEGIVYRYFLTFDFDEGFSSDLAVATGSAALSYPPFTRPSFALPPKDPNLLRLLQGSCRMPHAQGKDTFPIIDDLLMQSAANAFARPHQLFLTGDQIYADDVAAGLLLMLSDAADVLLGWKEILPIPAAHGGPINASEHSPFLRELPLLDAGFTSVDLDNHLWSLGEYICMYLSVWSEVLWDPSGVPSPADIITDVKTKVNPRDLKDVVEYLNEKRDTILSDLTSISEFRNTLPKVRRALANIPSYMIFDDHEVTDDWNMTRNFCRNVYGKPMGQQVLRNALVAYALCQHWGNAPEQFLDSPSPTPGSDLLKLLDTKNPTLPNAFAQKATSLEQNSATIDSLVGLHKESALAGRPEAGLFHDPHSLQYHYTVEGPGHQVIFTDTRTWRSFPKGGNEGSDVLPKGQFQQQILNTLDTGDRVLIVVISTNAPPVEPIRAATRNAFISNTFEHHPDVYEAWEVPFAPSDRTTKSLPFDRLLKALSDKLPLDANRHRVGQVILLSGDVHFSFASRLIYRATNRYEDVTPQPATAVIAQLVGSSFKKETGSTRGFHREGYTYGPKVAQVARLIKPHQPEGFVGWNLSSKTKVGDREVTTIIATPNGISKATVNLALELSRPTTLELESKYFGLMGDSILQALRLQVAPHYRYRLDYLLPTQQQVQMPRPPIPPMPAGTTPADRKQAAQVYNAATAAYRMYNVHAQPKVVGVNNFSELTFIWGAGPSKAVNHIIRWWNKNTSQVAVTTYTVSLNPNDPNFPDIKAKDEP